MVEPIVFVRCFGRIVVDNRDGEGNPGYRVKVKFPWLSEQETSFWARIAIPMGGSDRGTYVLPEIGR